MLADPSSKITTLPLAVTGAKKKGRANTNVSKTKTASCKNKSKLRRKRCHGALASRSRINRCQSKVLDTNTSRRRSLSMYMINMGILKAAKANAKGVKKPIIN
jgi:hypothetical protein